MRVALITPMKSPDAPTPSGDRTFARLIRQALERGRHQVSLPSEFVTWRSSPDGLASMFDKAPAAIAAAETLLQMSPPDFVLTYHNYHKSPDILGPALAKRFNVPYAIVEASRAPRRAFGPWAEGFEAADAAMRAADAIGAVTNRDAPALEEFAPEKVLAFPPFIDTAPFAGSAPKSESGLSIATAVMMRPGRKAESVALLAQAFRLVRAQMPGAEIRIAGEGPERDALEPLFPPGSFVGELTQEELAKLFSESDVFAFPAIDEPFGFVFLEAQAAGLPVVAGAARGVVDIVEDGTTGFLVSQGDPRPFADAILALFADTERRATMGAAARAFAAANDLDAGARRLGEIFAHATRRFEHRASSRRM